MLERRSALASVTPVASARISLREACDFGLTQLAAFDRAAEAPIAAVTGALPEASDRAVERNGRVIFRTGPHSFWCVGPVEDDLAQRLAGQAIVTPLSHSRTRIRIEGSATRALLAKGIPLDFHSRVFAPGMFAMTGLHHTPVLLHCLGEDRFELYAMRTFALNIWEWLEDAALEYA